MSNRNRDSGHNFERDIINELKRLGYDDAVSSRSESRNADARGIDILSEKFPFDAQCKSGVNQPNFFNLLTTTDADIIFYRKQQKKGKRFYQQGDIVVMDKIKFYRLLSAYNIVK